MSNPKKKKKIHPSPLRKYTLLRVYAFSHSQASGTHNWWIVGPTNCERRKTYTHNRVYFLLSSLFLSALPQSIAHQHLHLLSLSTPKLYSHCLASLPVIEIHWPSSLVPTILTFVLSENAQNCLSFLSFPTIDVGSSLAASNTWRCKKVFSSLFFNLFSEFFYLYMCFALFFCFYKLTYTFVCTKDLI